MKNFNPGKIFDNIVKKRRSVKNYLDETISDRIINQILEAARWAPSSGNIQPWYFVVVKDKDTKRILHLLVDTAYRKEIEHLRENGKNKLAIYLRSFWRNVKLEDAPVWIFAFYKTTSRHPYYLNLVTKHPDERLRELWLEGLKQSVAGAIQNVLLKAESMGYNTCLIGGAYYAKEEIERFFVLGDDCRFYSVILLGKGMLKVERPPKRKLFKVVEYFPRDIKKAIKFSAENIRDDKIIAHCYRTKDIALRLQREIGGNRDVVAFSAVLHDIAFMQDFKNHGKIGARLVQQRFRAEWNEEFLKQVCYCIRYHSLGSKPPILVPELICLHDADKIDFLVKMDKRFLRMARLKEEEIYSSFLSVHSEKILEEARRSGDK